MTSCIACGFENPDGHKYCGSCGSRLGPTAPGRCRECGNSVGQRDRFCMYCGASLPETGGAWNPEDFVRAAAPARAAADEASVFAAEAAEVPDLEDVILEDEPRHRSGEVPTAAMRAPVRLRVVAGRDQDKVFIVPADGGLIGRTEEADVALETDAYVDDEHARVLRDETGVVVEDLESVNGVFVRVQSKAVLKAGDEIKIGQAIFRVEK